METKNFSPELWREFPEINADSLWIFNEREQYPGLTVDYHGSFVPQIPHQLISRFTRIGDLVLDPMCGSGTTLAVARNLGRDAIGFDISRDLVKEVSQNLIGTHADGMARAEACFGDSTRMSTAKAAKQRMKELGHDSCSMMVFHPPYHDIIRFTDNPSDLSRCGSIEEFLSKLEGIFLKWIPHLRKDGYLVVVIGDVYKHKEWIPLGFRVLDSLQRCGISLNLRGIVVKNMTNSRGKRQVQNLWRYRNLRTGTFLFAHEYILVMRKNE
jgi:DNA modification methylase